MKCYRCKSYFFQYCTYVAVLYIMLLMQEFFFNAQHLYVCLKCYGCKSYFFEYCTYVVKLGVIVILLSHVCKYVAGKFDIDE